MRAPGDQGRAGCGLGAERRPAWGGQARPGQSGPARRGRGPEDAQTRARGSASSGAGRWGPGGRGVPLARPSVAGLGEGQGDAGASGSTRHSGASTAGWETWEVVGFSVCCESQASRISSSSSFFFETRVTGRRHGAAVVLGKAGAPTVEQACPHHCDAPDFRGE